MVLTSNLMVLSDRSGRMNPHPHRSRMMWRSSARSAFWLTEKLGLTSQPNRCRRLGWNDTQKQPSPSTNPEMYDARSIDKHQGRRLMEPFGSIQGFSPPESLRGSSRDDLTLGITRDAPASVRRAPPI